MSPFSSYRRIFRLAGPAYVIVAFLGRLPLAMSQLGVLLLVSGATGRYTAGGLAAGALAVSNAVGAPIAGALADRVGQRPVVSVQSLVGAAAITALVVLSDAGASTSALVVTAAAAGLTMPQIGPLARVRWRPITHGQGDEQPRLVDAAFSYEGAADEASFVLGPALVGGLVALVSPSGALLAAAGLLATFGTLFAIHPTARATHAHRSSVAGSSDRPLLTAAFLILAAAQLTIGVVFGATQTGTTVLATASGQPGVAGGVYALLGVGSVIAGLAVAGLPARIGYPRRIQIAALGLALLSAPLLTVGSIAALVPVVVLLGFAVAPYMISVFIVAERVVPPRRVGAAVTLLAGVTGAGYALGSAVAGRLADGAADSVAHGGGHTPAYAVTVTAGVIALALTTVFRGRLARALESEATLRSGGGELGREWLGVHDRERRHGPGEDDVQPA